MRSPAFAILGEIHRERVEMTEFLTEGIDAEALHMTTETLLRLKERVSGWLRAPKRVELRAEPRAEFGEVV